MIRFDKKTRWEGARYCCDYGEETLFPDGFEPRKYRMKQVNKYGELI